MVDAPSPRDKAHRDGCAGTAECDDTQVIARTLRWMERAVIGLNLCPFAKAVHAKGQVHVAVSHASGADGVLADLQREMQDLVALDPAVRDTTLLVLPHALTEFLEFNDFLDPAEALLDALGLHGVLQIASFHPRYQFAGTEPDDITNFSNRSPWPTLHLLREDSIARAVDAFPDPEAIFGANMKTLQQLGVEGWSRLDVGPHPAAGAAPSVASKARP